MSPRRTGDTKYCSVEYSINVHRFEWKIKNNRLPFIYISKCILKSYQHPHNYTTQTVNKGQEEKLWCTRDDFHLIFLFFSFLLFTFRIPFSWINCCSQIRWMFIFSRNEKDTVIRGVSSTVTSSAAAVWKTAAVNGAAYARSLWIGLCHRVRERKEKYNKIHSLMLISTQWTW